jgi:hypothetical protein
MTGPQAHALQQQTAAGMAAAAAAKGNLQLQQGCEQQRLLLLTVVFERLGLWCVGFGASICSGQHALLVEFTGNENSAVLMLAAAGSVCPAVGSSAGAAAATNMCGLLEKGPSRGHGVYYSYSCTAL